jgi:hypothetical protein
MKLLVTLNDILLAKAFQFFKCLNIKCMHRQTPEESKPYKNDF